MKTKHLPFPSSDNLRGICQAFGLDLTEKDTTDNSFDLRKIKNFPEGHMEEIEKIRKIITGLLPNVEPVDLLDLSTEEGRKESIDRRNTEYILPFCVAVLDFWMSEGLQIAVSEL